MNGYLVGLCGRAGSGKDEVAKIVAELRPDWIVLRDAFADRLKLSAARMFFPDIDLADAVDWADSFKHNGYVQAHEVLAEPCCEVVTGRQLLQRYGTEMHRDVFGQDFWLSAVLPNPALAFFGRPDAFDVLVVTDVRFDNEVERVRDCGGHVWLVDRPGAIQEDDHPSEVVPDHDLVVRNHGDLDHLRDEVRLALAGGFR